MTDLVKAGIAFVCVEAICMLLCVFTGAWIMHRCQNHLSPVPNVAEVVRSAISVFRRPKAPEKKPKVSSPNMRA